MRDPFLDDPADGELGGALGCLLAAMAWTAAITVVVVWVARGWATAGALAAVYLCAAARWRFAGETRQIGAPDHPAAGATVPRPATAGGAWVVAVAGPSRFDVLFNLADPGCERCPDHPGRAAQGSIAPCPCTAGKRGRW